MASRFHERVGGDWRTTTRATEDEEVLIGVTIESLEAVENIDSILDVPDLGFVFVGPFDLSVAVGSPGELDNPDVQDAVETVRSRSVERGVPVGNLGFGMEDVNEKARNGYQILNIGTTALAIQEIVAEWLNAYEGTLNPLSPERHIHATRFVSVRPAGFSFDLGPQLPLSRSLPPSTTTPTHGVSNSRFDGNEGL